MTKHSITHCLFCEQDPGLGKLRNSILVDLGSGDTSYGYRLACREGASEYIGVDSRFASQTEKRILSVVKEKGGPLPRFTVKSKCMLEYLRELKNRSVSIMACGIENCVLPSKKFRIALENEIERVLAFGGVFLSWLSCMHPKGLHMRKVSNTFYVFNTEAKDTDGES